MESILRVRSQLIILTLLLLLSGIAGYFLYGHGGKEIWVVVRGYLKQFQSLPPIKLFLFIFLNNALKGLFVSILLGSLFGILPVLSTVGNGILMGLAIHSGIDTRGIGETLLRMLPHGIIEIPVFLLCGGYGLWLGVGLVNRIRGHREARFREQVGIAMGVYFRVALPMIFVAAVIETFLVRCLQS
jgi:uncharacterized membrane protein SpoIIM required for sporulation